ncbi:RICIN domain-containing protein [Streptomyces sp. NBC_01142]|uniref:ricin-type beta-trefoil lectin domain protein n=1 Tax=Streptomyces sp. NBC_01142 TaxID=2975865 RepID=UPI0022571AF7|nr:ricin-type beta-trefoil lectin domain protein [Streptomyces sp. NBC_01142]MCX4825181.1 RICIN domain-containing protein [Streptomyces sp. NBC_01142]
MITEPTSRGPGRRATTTLLAVALTSLVGAMSPLTAGTAHADTSATAGLSLSPRLTSDTGLAPSLDLAKDSADYGTEIAINKTPMANWSFVPNGDGSFLIRNDKTQKCIDFNTDNNHLVEPVYCDRNNSKQNWYLQPSKKGGGYYLIRNVNNDKCMDVFGGSSNDGTVVGLYGCHGDSNQEWIIGPTPSPGSTGPTLADLATAYALKQCSNSSSIIKSCAYTITGDSVASVGNLKRVSANVWNKTTDPAERTITWTQTTSQTNTVGGSITVTSEVGINVEFVTAKVSSAVSAHYDHSWTQTDTVSDANKVSVKPPNYSWAMRGQLMKTVTGRWTFTNDLGGTWSGDGTATVPAVDGTDNLSSDLVLCTSDSTDQECVDNR